MVFFFHKYVLFYYFQLPIKIFKYMRIIHDKNGAIRKFSFREYKRLMYV